MKLSYTAKEDALHRLQMLQTDLSEGHNLGMCVLWISSLQHTNTERLSDSLHYTGGKLWLSYTQLLLQRKAHIDVINVAKLDGFHSAGKAAEKVQLGLETMSLGNSILSADLTDQ